jgi:DNA gyrase subunit B
VDQIHLAAIQDRRDLYGAGGVRHLILEVLAYANDEADSLGRVGRARVIMQPNATVTVVDDGRGTDTRIDSEGHVIRKPVMATKDIRFFDSLDSPLLPDGLPRRGMSTVAALSTELVHENHRAHGSWSQTYRQGIPEDQLQTLNESETTGTSVRFQTEVEGTDALTAGDLVAFPWLHVEVDQRTDSSTT